MYRTAWFVLVLEIGGDDVSLTQMGLIRDALSESHHRYLKVS